MKNRSFLFLIGILLSLLIGSFFSEPITPVYAQSAPSIGEFEAPSTVYANKWFYLNGTIDDSDGVSDLDNCTVALNVGPTTTTFYAGSGDGHVSKVNTDWNVAHDATWGSGSQTNYDEFYIGSSYSTILSSYFIHRAFLPFDTSNLPNNATIQSATLNISIWDVDVTSGIRNYALVQTSQPSMSSLTNDDFELCGTVDNPAEGADRITITSTGWKSWTLNATGISWINKTGWTKLGIRTGWLDCDDVAPTDGVQEGYIYSNSSESTAPKLEITYTTVTLNWDQTIGFQSSGESVTLNASSCIEDEKNSTALTLSWYIKLNSYTEGQVDVLADDTKVYDIDGESGSGSHDDLFTFSYITLNLQARDSDELNLLRQIIFRGILGNGTSFDENSDSGGYLALATCYGTHTVNTWWGEHLVDSSYSFSVTADKTENIVTKVKRLSDGAKYILFSINETVIPTVTYVSDTELRLPLVSSTGTKELKIDNLNWVEVGQPHWIKYGSFEKNRGSSDWDWSDNVFKVPISFSTIDITIYWTEKQPPPVGPPGPGPPGPIYVPGEPIIEEPEEEEKPTIPGEQLLPGPVDVSVRPSADMTPWGVAIIVAVVAVGLLSKQLKKQSLAGLWQLRKQKRKKAKFPKKKRKQSSFKRKNR